MILQRNISLLTLIVIFSVFSSAQDNDTGMIVHEQMKYIETLDKYITMKISVNDDMIGFKVKSSQFYDLQPNDYIALRLSVNYRWISFSINFAPDFLPGNDDNILKGNTNSTAFSLGLNFSHWMQTLSYSNIKGYYLNNTGDFVSGWVKGTDPYLQFPDLLYQDFHGYTAYKFNENFSTHSLSTQTEQQLNSAGSFIPSLSYDYYIVDNRVNLTGLNSSQKSNNIELLFSLGYFYTIVIKEHFYVSAGVVPGSGIIITKLLTRLPGGEIKSDQINLIKKIDGSLAFGYNSERFFTGSQIMVSDASYDQNTSSTVITRSRFTYHIFTGVRFDAPTILSDIIDNVERIVMK